MGLGFAIGLGATLSVLILTSFVFIVLGVIFFAVSLFIIKASAGLVGFQGVNADFAVLSAAILSAASLISAKK